MIANILTLIAAYCVLVGIQILVIALYESGYAFAGVMVIIFTSMALAVALMLLRMLAVR